MHVTLSASVLVWLLALCSVMRLRVRMAHLRCLLPSFWKHLWPTGQSQTKGTWAWVRASLTCLRPCPRVLPRGCQLGADTQAPDPCIQGQDLKMQVQVWVICLADRVDT